MFHQLIAKRNEEMGQLFQMGFPKSLIAEAYGLSRKQTSKIIRRYNKGL